MTKTYISNYKEISMKGTAKELVKKHEGLSYQAAREGDNFMMHIHRQHSDHYKRMP